MYLNNMWNRTVLPLMTTSMDLRSRNQDVITTNIANAETPRYKAKELVFEDQLRQAVHGNKKDEEMLDVARTHPDHLPQAQSASFQPYLQQQDNQTVRNDGNDVELEKEMSEMIENSIMYNASVQIASKKIEGMKKAIREGK